MPEPFDHYLFIEKSKGRVGELKATIEMDYPTLLQRCNFRPGDSNTVLKAWCKERDWQKERAVVFLDPYGMQVEWSTIEVLAATKAIDLWYLFPLGVGVARLLTYHGDIDEAWQNQLDLLFGTPEWRTEFYRVSVGQPDLFGESHQTVERDAPAAKMRPFSTPAWRESSKRPPKAWCCGTHSPARCICSVSQRRTRRVHQPH